MTVGDAADEAELGSLPANVSAKRWIPQAAILAKASAMVGHGGFGTTTGALLAGVPQVVVPLFADQPYNAARVRISASAWSPRRRTRARSAPPSSACSPSRRSAASRHGWRASRSRSRRSTRSSPRCSSSIASARERRAA
jgi:hypothetical protein